MAESSHQDTLVLTVNSRLARHLLFKNSEQQRNNGNVAWETPQIFELRAWLKIKWEESSPDHFILSDLQSIKIWESIIKSSPECNQAINNEGIRNPWNLLNERSAAQSAAKAYRLIKEYKLNINNDSLTLVKETNLFTKWIKQYKRILDKNQAIDPADLIDSVREGMKENRISIPEKIELNGFEEITPQLGTWLDFLRNRVVKYLGHPFQSE